MKKAVVSFAAVLVLLASFASPSLAAGTSNTASNDKCTIRVSGPETAAAGETVRFSGTITLNNDGSSSRKPVIYELGISSNGGPVARIPLRSGVRNMTPGTTKSATRAITINDRVTPGEYTIYLDVTVDGESLIVSLPITITK
jgi:hypothetical protein